MCVPASACAHKHARFVILAIHIGNFTTSVADTASNALRCALLVLKLCTHERQLEEREQIVGVGLPYMAASGPEYPMTI